MKTLTVEPLTRQAFAPFGDVIEMHGITPQPMNRGMAERYDALGRVEILGEQAQGVISLVHSRQYQPPHRVDLVERHPLGSQAFIPFERTPFIVIVGPPGESIDSDSLRAFKTNGSQGINYHPGVWHGPLFTPYAEMSFVCVDRAGEGHNCDEVMIPAEQQCQIDI